MIQQGIQCAKRWMREMTSSKLGVVLGSCSALVSMYVCMGKEKASSYQVAHISSPNGSLEAVLTETNGGATTSFGYEVSVGLKGSKSQKRVASLYGAVRSDYAYGVNVSWANDHVLQVQYLRAKAVQNVAKSIDINGQQVGVEFQADIEDPSAPSGGMQCNLNKQSH